VSEPRVESGHSPAKDVEMPVAAVEGIGKEDENNIPTPVDEDISIEDAKEILRNAGYEEFDLLTKISDAEEAIKAARRKVLPRVRQEIEEESYLRGKKDGISEERQRILNKIDSYLEDIEKELDRIDETEHGFSDVGNAGARLHHKFQKETLENLREDLESCKDSADSSGDLQDGEEQEAREE
jgi:uncharacterized protein YoxC